jgi:5-methylthioribose kinase
MITSAIIGHKADGSTEAILAKRGNLRAEFRELAKTATGYAELELLESTIGLATRKRFKTAAPAETKVEVEAETKVETPKETKDGSKKNK